MDPDGNLFSQLPHWTYSTALAAYLQAQEASSSPADSLKPGISAVQLYPSIVVALLEKYVPTLLLSARLGLCSRMLMLLHESYELVSFLTFAISSLSSIACRLEDKGVHPDQEFKQILKHKLFKDACEHDNASLSHLESIYVERQYTLYKVSA